jgi:hypothetical protein
MQNIYIYALQILICYFHLFLFSLQFQNVLISVLPIELSYQLLTSTARRK